jgi:hypothetical protein
MTTVYTGRHAYRGQGIGRGQRANSKIWKSCGVITVERLTSLLDASRRRDRAPREATKIITRWPA